MHAAKATARSVVTATTIGHGNAVLSTIEDVVASVLSVIAIVAPVVALVCIVVLVALAGTLLIRFLRKRQSRHAM